MKKCPYCAEEIQDEAILCRFCRSDVRVLPAPAGVSAPRPKFRSGGNVAEGGVSESSEEPQLPEEIECPHCGELLALEPEERRDRLFDCPLCCSRIDLRSSARRSPGPATAPGAGTNVTGSQANRSAEPLQELNAAQRYVRRLRLFVKENQDYYLSIWRKMDNSDGIGKVMSWNWGAFLGALAWMGFRRMYLYSFIAVCMYAAGFVLLELFGVSRGIISVFQLLFCAGLGLSGNHLYRTHADAKLSEISLRCPDGREQEIEIVASGGQSAPAAVWVSVMGFSVVFLVAVLYFGSGLNGQTGIQSQFSAHGLQHLGDHKSGITSFSPFNTSTKDAFESGNVLVGMLKVENFSAQGLWQVSTPTTAASLVKSPYSAIGNLYRLSGRVYKIEELPPNLQGSGHWSEILLLPHNAHSPLGETTLDFLFNGDMRAISPNTYMSIAGYFAGTYESDNALGGRNEALVIVGNAYKY